MCAIKYCLLTYLLTYIGDGVLLLRRSLVHHSQLHEMLMKLEPPLGFGRKCPYRLAYRVSVSFTLFELL